MIDDELLRLVNGAILPGFNGTELPAWLDTALGTGLGGVVYFRQNIDAARPGQLATLSVAIRARNPDAVIAVDEEGGDVTRLQSAAGSDLPGAEVLGRLDDVRLTEAAGRALGGLCRHAGINLNFAPVADVNTNPDNPVIGVRSFGADPALVARHTAAMVTGIQSMGVGACAKHFPGHGDTVADSHVALPRLGFGLDQLDAVHLPPFRAAIGAGARAMMTAHIVVPGLGSGPNTDRPATLNPAAGDLLRSLGSLAFDGLLVTDALDMAAIRASVGSGAGAVQALLAGADLLCVGNPANVGYTDPSAGLDEADYVEVRDAVLAAVEDGSLPVDILRRSQRRRRAFAQWTRDALGDGYAEGPAAVDASGVSEAEWIEAAQRALTVTGPGTAASNRQLVVAAAEGQPMRIVLVDARGGHNMAAGRTADCLAEAIRAQWPEALLELVPPGKLAGPAASATATPAASVEAQAGETAPGAACVVVVNSLEPGTAGHNAALQALDLHPAAIAVNTGFAEATRPPLPTINAFGYSRVGCRAVVRLLAGQSSEQAGLPGSARLDQSADDYAGLRAELGQLVTESSNPRYADLGSMDTRDLAAAMNQEDARVPAAIAAVTAQIAAIIDRIADGMSRGGRLLYVGAGTPGRIGILDASECPPTFGTDPSLVVGVIAGGTRAITSAVENAEDDDGAGVADMASYQLGPHDSVVGISASGRTPYVLAAIGKARDAGAFTVGFSCNAHSPLGEAAELPLEIEVGPEFLTGSTRLKAGTAQKLVLNMISTLTMVHLGKTYKNLMVDLTATNAKLHARSERTVMAATGVDATAAAAALLATGGSVKAAILVLLTGLSPAEAGRTLAAQRGYLQQAISQNGQPHGHQEPVE